MFVLLVCPNLNSWNTILFNILNWSLLILLLISHLKYCSYLICLFFFFHIRKMDPCRRYWVCVLDRDSLCGRYGWNWSTPENSQSKDHPHCTTKHRSISAEIFSSKYPLACREDNRHLVYQALLATPLFVLTFIQSVHNRCWHRSLGPASLMVFRISARSTARLIPTPASLSAHSCPLTPQKWNQFLSTLTISWALATSPGDQSSSTS